MAAGILTKLLVHTKVTRYMEFKVFFVLFHTMVQVRILWRPVAETETRQVIDGSFVYIGPTGGFFGSSSGSIHKVRNHRHSVQSLNSLPCYRAYRSLPRRVRP